ncbi:DUF3626 domain-containing protein [Actinopolymorpha alba]|uniref:DUF3626 domain-containing protein n=1 Tax=Actinopolymorpha alba TaxID=533267 RepID=UPI000590528C|nr:DUF3626 domain-containing protein [Actinopolymorpha alba]
MSRQDWRSPQQRALDHVTARSTGDPLDPSLRVTLNFHPDRIDPSRGTGERAAVVVLRALARDGIYRSQFETGTSNGGLSAHPGGDRWRWESRIFGGAYDDAPARERPKYGALNFRGRDFGGSPRFGSAHLRLAADVLTRTTFCFPDSYIEQVDFGVGSRMALIEKADSAGRDFLDDYIEAQVHGPLELARDVEAVVLDPCYRGTEIEEIAGALPCAVEWHRGFRLSVDVLEKHPEFRGQEFVDLGRELARDGYLDARIIGAAARTRRYDEQPLKRVWHYVARFGCLDKRYSG